jgi:predicted acylesterase/phospholipase RssA
MDLKETFDQTKPNIKHLVISSGVMYFLSFYGALKHTHQQGIWKVEKLESIYATSAGALTAIIIILGYDWQILDNYFINRPWQNTYKLNMASFFNMFQDCGLFDIKAVENVLHPLLNGKNIEPNITLKDFYELIPIDLHFFTTNLNTFSKIDISHTTHPDWTVIEAVYASACAPLLLVPLLKDGETYIDGAFFVKNPLNECLLNNAKSDEILCINKKSDFLKSYSKNPSIDDSKTPGFTFPPLFNYIYKIITVVGEKLIIPVPKIQHEMQIGKSTIDEHDIYSIINDSENRKNFIDHGVEVATQFTNEILIIQS